MTALLTTPATEYLNLKSVPFSTFHHAGKVKSVEQAAAERGQKPDQVVRSILFRIAKSDFALVLMPGPNQISWKTLRSYLGRARLTMASPEEVLEITGYPIGAVCPFGLKTVLPILVDKSIQEQDVVSLGSGQHSTALIMKTNDLLNALQSNYQWVNLKK